MIMTLRPFLEENFRLLLLGQRLGLPNGTRSQHPGWVWPHEWAWPAPFAKQRDFNLGKNMHLFETCFAVCQMH